MSKSIKVLLLTLLALCLTFGAAFAAAPVKINLNAGNAEGDNTLTGYATPVVLRFTMGENNTATLEAEVDGQPLGAGKGAASDGSELSVTNGPTITIAAEKGAIEGALADKAESAQDVVLTFAPGENGTTGVFQVKVGTGDETALLGTSNKNTITFTDENVGTLVLTVATESGGAVTGKYTPQGGNEEAEEAVVFVKATETQDNTATLTGSAAAKSDTVTWSGSEGETVGQHGKDLTAVAETMFTLSAGQSITGTLTPDTDTSDEETENGEFAVEEEQVVLSTTGTGNEAKVASIDFSGQTFGYASKDNGGEFNIAASEPEYVGVEISETDEEVYYFLSLTLAGSKDVEAAAGAAFDSADITVFANGKDMGTVTFTSKDAAKSVTVSTDVTVSFDLSKVSFDLVSVDGKGKTSADLKVASYVFSVDIESSSKDVYIYFTSGDASFEAKLTINVDSSSSATSETYKLSLASTDKFVFTGSNGQSATFTASVDKYSASSALASVDASGAWGTMTFNVSSDVFADFVISVDFPASASVAAVYYREGTTGSYTDAADDYTAKVLTPLEGYYRLVFSADLVASSDSSVKSGDGYFGFTIQVVSVDSGTSDSSSTLVEESAASVEPVTRSDGNMEIPAGKTIKTKFLSSNGTLTAAIVSAFFNSNNATSVEMATPAQLTAALSQLGFTASDLGDAENGYKIVGLALPSNVTLSEGMKFFVMITTAKDGSGKSALGMGVLSSKQIGLGFLPIVFKLLKNPANTNNYMTFDADEYFVGATNDMGESSSSTSARVVFVTADDQTFTIAADDTTLLQGQNASGDAQAYTGDDDDDDDDNQETSSHGSSSGCDAGFGALALLAVAGALAARKVRK